MVMGGNTPNYTLEHRRLRDIIRNLQRRLEALERASLTVPRTIPLSEATEETNEESELESADSEWQPSVASRIDFTSAEPASPNTGDRYLNTTTGTSDQTSQSVTADYLYEWDEAEDDWLEEAPDEGYTVYVDDEDKYYTYDSANWVLVDTLIQVVNSISWQGVATNIALADGDEFLATDADDSDNIKAVLASAVWTYIQDKIEAVADAVAVSTDKVLFTDAGVLKQEALADIDETVLTAIKTYIDAQTHEPTLTDEQVQDKVGAMVSGNTETLITVTYQDADGTIDFVVAESSIDHDALTNFVAAEHLSLPNTIQNVLSDVSTLTGAQLLDLLMLFSGNKGWIPCTLEQINAGSAYNDLTIGSNYKNTGSNDFAAVYVLPFPKVLGSKQLVISEIAINITAADGTDYIDRIRIFDNTTSIYDHGTNLTAIEAWSDDGTDADTESLPYTVTASGNRVSVYINIKATTAGQIEWEHVSLRCHYE